MELKLILKDGTEVEIVEAGYNQHYVVICQNANDFQQLWDKMTEENLSTIQITGSDGTDHTIIGSKLEGTQAVTNPDGTITGHFYLHGGNYIQPTDEYSEAGEMLLGEEG